MKTLYFISLLLITVTSTIKASFLLGPILRTAAEAAIIAPAAALMSPVVTAFLPSAPTPPQPLAPAPLPITQLPHAEISRIRYYDDNPDAGMLEQQTLQTPSTSLSTLRQSTRDSLKELDIPQILMSAKNAHRPVILNINVNELQAQQDTKPLSPSLPPSVGLNRNQLGAPIAPGLYDLMRSYVKKSTQWVKEHKLRFLGYCTLGLYASTQSYLIYLTTKLNTHACWSKWKIHCTLEDLYRTPHDVLVKDVIESLNTKGYKNAPERNALSGVIKEIDAEIAALSHYQKIVGFLEWVRVRRIFFYNARLKEETSARVQRLTYLKNVLLGYLDQAPAAS